MFGNFNVGVENFQPHLTSPMESPPPFSPSGGGQGEELRFEIP